MFQAESQTIEFKASWRDEYLKWICGFANADGGKLYIGVDDTGKVVGVANAKKLMEEIPNKVQAGLGIVCNVELLNEGGLDYIEIRVNPSSYPVSYHGEYHFRSGSTKQQLTGIALSEFIMRKTGVRWEDVTVDEIAVEDLDDESFKIFRREALRSKRMTETELNVSNGELLSKLHLMRDGKLKKSAILLFYSDPSVLQNGSSVKVGRFSERGEILYQDLFEGSLFTTAEKIIDLIFLKYLKAKVSYEHDRRVETYPFAREAIREAIYNSLAHNCYVFGTPIQIRIDDDEIIISNRCILPNGWTVDTLMEPHDSIPYNPDIAGAFFRAGYIETWGQGIHKICEACREIGADAPRYELIGTGLRVHFKALESAKIDDSKRPNRHDVGLDVGLEDRLIELTYDHPEMTMAAMAENLGVTTRTVERAMKKLRETGHIVRVGGKRYGHWQVLK